MPVLNQEILINPELSHACVTIRVSNGLNPDQADTLKQMFKLMVKIFHNFTPKFCVYIQLCLPFGFGVGAPLGPADGAGVGIADGQ